MDSKSKPSLSYVLFLYRQQLGKGQIQSTMRLNRAKIVLTDKLIRKTARNMDKCTIDDMLAINRGIEFKKKLKHQMKTSSQSAASVDVQNK